MIFLFCIIYNFEIMFTSSLIQPKMQTSQISFTSDKKESQTVQVKKNLIKKSI
jgi:hypothetical protein